MNQERLFFPAILKCVVCSSLLEGRQRRFCSYRCKVEGQSNAVYANQKRRGHSRKNKLLLEKGGECVRCGYERCSRALTFHHRDPTRKDFPLDIRNCANRSLKILAEEALKCDLLCANCHTEVENELYMKEMPSAEDFDYPVLPSEDSFSKILCVSCSSPLRGRQRRFCSRHCKIKRNSQTHFACQKRQGIRRKIALLLEKGGKCIRCGYANCLRALTFHHRDSTGKAFNLDVRTCGRCSPARLAAEAEKCDLLCLNCHAEVEEELYMARVQRPLVLNTEAC